MRALFGVSLVEGEQRNAAKRSERRTPAVLRRAEAQCEAAFMAWASAVVVGVPDDAECDIGIHVACARVDETRYSDPERPE